MRAITFPAIVASFVVGVAVVHGAPPRWRLEPWQGILFGTSLYMGVVHRWLAARGAAWDLAWRAALFVAIVAGEAYAYFEWLPPADMRAPFVMLSAWIVAETLLVPRAPRAPGTLGAPGGAPITAALPRA